MGLGDLAVSVLQKVAAAAVKNARSPGGERRRMASGGDAVARRLDADDANVGVI